MLKSVKKRGPACSLRSEAAIRLGMPGAASRLFDIVWPGMNSSAMTSCSGR